MIDLELTHALLTDSFVRVREGVVEVTEGLEPEQLGHQVGPAANPIGWLVWHLTRVQDDHLAELAGVEQVWPRWRDRFALPYAADATGYGQSTDEVSQVHVTAELLAGYHEEVHSLTLRYLDSL